LIWLSISLSQRPSQGWGRLLFNPCGVFTIDERNKIRDWILDAGLRDDRISGGAVTGSGALNAEDAWSDVDVAFGVKAEADANAILSDWTVRLQHEVGLLHHFDLQAGSAVYRVYLLPKGLELDVGLWPAAQFGAAGEKFRSVFGQTAEITSPSSVSLDHLIGLCWHHALHAHAAIARSKPWEAEYYVSALRDHALEIACLRYGLPAIYARGTDDLPREVTRPFETGLARSLETEELQRALEETTGAFLDEVSRSKPELSTALSSVIREILRQ
jgi:hypothetical protein